MIRHKLLRQSAVLALLCFVFAGASSAWADQVTMSYVDADGNAQSYILDNTTSTQDLALAASLAGDDGVGLVNNANAGSTTLAEIAAAMAQASPIHAPGVAQAFAETFPEYRDAIVAAVNAVAGVDTVAVEAATHFGPQNEPIGPQEFGSKFQIDLDLVGVEPKASDN